MTGRPKRTEDFLREEYAKTTFVGTVIGVRWPEGVRYNVQNGGWNGEGLDTWLTEHVLPRFDGKLVKISIEEVDPDYRLEA
jgi:hypothetical protein